MTERGGGKSVVSKALDIARILVYMFLVISLLAMLESPLTINKRRYYRKSKYIGKKVPCRKRTLLPVLSPVEGDCRTACRKESGLTGLGAKRFQRRWVWLIIVALLHASSLNDLN